MSKSRDETAAHNRRAQSPHPLGTAAPAARRPRIAQADAGPKRRPGRKHRDVITSGLEVLLGKSVRPRWSCHVGSAVRAHRALVQICIICEICG
jgi:hypothetical protein